MAIPFRSRTHWTCFWVPQLTPLPMWQVIHHCCYTTTHFNEFAAMPWLGGLQPLTGIYKPQMTLKDAVLASRLARSAGDPPDGHGDYDWWLGSEIGLSRHQCRFPSRLKMLSTNLQLFVVKDHMDHMDHSSYRPNRFKVEKPLLWVYLTHGRLLAPELLETSSFAISSLNVKHLRLTITHQNGPSVASMYVQQLFSIMIKHY